MSEYVNLCVVNQNDGGDLLLENDGGKFLYLFHEQLVEGDVEETTLEHGLTELDKYFVDCGTRSEEDKVKWNDLKEQYKELVKDVPGKFYLWGVEYDYELMFVDD